MSIWRMFEAYYRTSHHGETGGTRRLVGGNP